MINKANPRTKNKVSSNKAVVCKLKFKDSSLAYVITNMMRNALLVADGGVLARELIAKADFVDGLTVVASGSNPYVRGAAGTPEIELNLSREEFMNLSDGGKHIRRIEDGLLKKYGKATLSSRVCWRLAPVKNTGRPAIKPTTPTKATPTKATPTKATPTKPVRAATTEKKPQSHKVAEVRLLTHDEFGNFFGSIEPAQAYCGYEHYGWWLNENAGNLGDVFNSEGDRVDECELGSIVSMRGDEEWDDPDKYIDDYVDPEGRFGVRPVLVVADRFAGGEVLKFHGFEFKAICPSLALCRVCVAECDYYDVDKIKKKLAAWVSGASKKSR